MRCEMLSDMTSDFYIEPVPKVSYPPILWVDDLTYPISEPLRLFLLSGLRP